LGERGVGDDVDPADERAPFGGDHARGEHADGRGLARAVRSEQSEDLAAANAQVELLDRAYRTAAAVEDLGQILRDDDVAVSVAARVQRLRVNSHRGLLPGWSVRAAVQNTGRMGIVPGMSGGMRVVFNGVRGSTPCAGTEYSRYGGHSSSVAIEREGADPI